MAQQYADMYQAYDNNRSPGSTRGYPSTLNRQPSRHFENSYGMGQTQGLYTAEDHAARYEGPSRFENRMPSATLHANYQYDTQSWNYGGANGAMGGTGRVKPQTRRAGLPTVWMDPQMQQQSQNMDSYQMNGQFNPQMMQEPQRGSPPAPGRLEREELIPTAIVIKNIPFAVKKEQLVALMSEMQLPLPYAFNYHFDNGVFRGLAFANFTNPEETRHVIGAMNHMELQGRKLRVEYKKMLPAEERERIERDKREKRGQLQEQHQPIPPGQVTNPLHPQSSMASIGSNHHPTSPSPVSMRGKLEIDLNDPTTLGYYNELMLFKNTEGKETLIFPSTVSPTDRRIIHTLAHHMGLEHRSEGQGDTRCVQILKRGATISPPVPQGQSLYNPQLDGRRILNRAATIDFSETREAGSHYHTLRNQTSGGHLDIPNSPGMHPVGPNLRAAKSFADLPSGTPNLTPTSASGMNAREDFLISGMNSMSMYERPQNNRSGRIGQERETHTPSAGPIGSQRPNGNSNNYEENPRNGSSTVIERQPRGPGNDWGSGAQGFGRQRQNGHANRGSDSSDRNGAASRFN